ncbi:MAG: DUF1178 family protein, partial [Candidatus Puniceispirillaceae bacterium]
EKKMKKFALKCENSHEFEGWFASADAVVEQASKGLIDCPYCGSLEVKKQLSAPNLSTPKTKARIAQKAVQTAPDTKIEDKKPVSAPSAVMPAGNSAGAAAYHTALRMAVQQLRKTVESQFTNVGDKFAEEARKIHNGEAEENNIYGTCTRQETEELLEEGVEIMPLPDLPPEH